MKPLQTLMASLFLAGAGCATSGPSTPKPPDEYRLADGTRVVCRMEAETGSHIRERVCRRVEGTSPQARSELDRVLSPPPVNTRSPN